MQRRDTELKTILALHRVPLALSFLRSRFVAQWWTVFGLAVFLLRSFVYAQFLDDNGRGEV